MSRLLDMNAAPALGAALPVAEAPGLRELLDDPLCGMFEDERSKRYLGHQKVAWPERSHGETLDRCEHLSSAGGSGGSTRNASAHALRSRRLVGPRRARFPRKGLGGISGPRSETGFFSA